MLPDKSDKFPEAQDEEGQFLIREAPKNRKTDLASSGSVYFDTGSDEAY